MKAAEARAWRNLSAHHRAVLAIRALRDATADEGIARRSMPRAQREEYWDVFGCGVAVLTHLRPAALWLDALTAAAEGQLDLLATFQAWAAERVGLSLGLEDDQRTPLLSHGPTQTDLKVVAAADRVQRRELVLTADDWSAVLAIKRFRGAFAAAWSALVALEAVVPLMNAVLRDRELVDELLATQLQSCRVRLDAAHAEAEELLGPVALPEADAQTVAVMRALLAPTGSA